MQYLKEATQFEILANIKSKRTEELCFCSESSSSHWQQLYLCLCHHQCVVMFLCTFHVCSVDLTQMYEFIIILIIFIVTILPALSNFDRCRFPVIGPSFSSDRRMGFVCLLLLGLFFCFFFSVIQNNHLLLESPLTRILKVGSPWASYCSIVCLRLLTVVHILLWRAAVSLRSTPNCNIWKNCRTK